MSRYFGTVLAINTFQIVLFNNGIIGCFEKKPDKPVLNIFAETVLASAVQKDIGLTDLLRFTAMLFPDIEDM